MPWTTRRHVSASLPWVNKSFHVNSKARSRFARYRNRRLRSGGLSSRQRALRPTDSPHVPPSSPDVGGCTAESAAEGLVEVGKVAKTGFESYCADTAVSQTRIQKHPV